jgi:putative tricarboxylic transport membrane protein
MADIILKRFTRREVAVGLGLPGIMNGLGPSWASADAWVPQRSVEFVVPSAAGSTMDLLARLIVDIWRKYDLLTTTVTVQAKGGGGGALAWTYVSRKAGDGHFLAISGPTLVANDILRIGDLKYADVTPIAQLFTEYTCFVVRTEASITSADDLLKALRSSRPPSIAIAPGFGSSSHVAVLKLARAAQIDPNTLTVVPFKGANESVTAVLGRHIDVTSATMSVISPMIEAGRLRAVAITAPQRLGGVNANIPTWRELGLDVVEGNWRGVVGPKDLPEPVVDYWNGKLAAAVNTLEWMDALQRNDWNADFSTGAAAKRFLEMQHAEFKATLSVLKQ